MLLVSVTQMTHRKTKQISKHVQILAWVWSPIPCFGKNPAFPIFGKDVNYVWRARENTGGWVPAPGDWWPWNPRQDKGSPGWRAGWQVGLTTPRGNRRKGQPLQSPWIRWASSPALSLPPVRPLSTHLPWAAALSWAGRSWVSWYLTKSLCTYVNSVQHILLFLKKPLCSGAFQGMAVLHMPSAPNICSFGFFVTPSLEILLLL